MLSCHIIMHGLFSVHCPLLIAVPDHPSPQQGLAACCLHTKVYEGKGHYRPGCMPSLQQWGMLMLASLTTPYAPQHAWVAHMPC